MGDSEDTPVAKSLSCRGKEVWDRFRALSFFFSGIVQCLGVPSLLPSMVVLSCGRYRAQSMPFSVRALW